MLMVRAPISSHSMSATTPPLRSRGRHVVLAALSCALLSLLASSCATRGAATLSGRLTVEQATHVAYNAGFRSEQQLVAIVSIAIAESSLVTNQRHWHPEYGYRLATDVIGVAGPSSVWDASHTRQLHSDRGLFQISSRWWPEFTDRQCDDPDQAARIAFVLSKGGVDFSLWDTYESQSAQSHYDRSTNGWPAVRPIVRLFLARARTV
jgi:Lysozyme like domain